MMLQTLNQMPQLLSLLAFLLLLVSFPSVSGDIRCHCDSQSCKDLGATECRAEFYCYVSFRAVQHGNRTQRQQNHRPPLETLTATSMFDSGSSEEGGGVWTSAKPRPTKQYYEAVNRGCVAPSQLDICIGNADDETRNGLLIRCCQDSWCNSGRTLEIAHAESSEQRKHASVSSLPSVFGEDPLYNELPQTPQRFPFIKTGSESVKSGQPFRNRENLQAAPRGPFSPITSRSNNQMKSIWGLPTPASSTQISDLSLSDTAKPSVSEEAPKSYSIVLQPLHIAIGVCLVILMVVAILLHVLIVLQRRHRRLKRELRQTQKSGLRQDLGDQQSPMWMHHQSPGMPQHTSLAILNGTRILAHFDVQGMPDERGGGGQPTQLGMQQMQYAEQNGEPYTPANCSVYGKQAPRKSGCCTTFCLWCRRKPFNQHTYDTVFYDEVVHRNNAAVPQELTRCTLPATSKSSIETSAYTPFLDAKNSNGFYSSAKNADDSAILTKTNSPGPCAATTDSDNRNKLGSQIPPTYAPGSSMSGSSANNQSTAESSLPTQSSTGWTEPRGTMPCGNNNNNNSNTVSTVLKNQTLGTERPSLSGSSEVGCLIGSEFDMRRANAALPPTMPPPPPQAPPPPPMPVVPGRSPVVGQIGMDSPPEPLGLASFRCATSQDTCALVAPYAQLQLSLSLDQYDTPEEIFRADWSDSSCSYAQRASSNPTTNSSLLQSYCEHGGGDYKS